MIIISKIVNKNKLDSIFDIVNVLIMLILCVSVIYPFLNLLSTSLTPGDVSLTTFRLFTPKISFEAYGNVFHSKYIATGFYNTLLRTGLGTSIQLIAILLTAYPLSKKYFPHRGFWTGFIVFTMFFSGGLIPNYMLVKNMGLLGSVWSLILPGLIPTFTMLIVRNFFMTIPDSLEEAARIDGANDLIILFKIILPICTPIIATVVLWQSVHHWNAWFDCLLYISKPENQVLQIVLRRTVVEGLSQMMSFESVDTAAPVTTESVKASTIIVATLPILTVYPFVQRYFVKGIMVGSLKG